MPFKSESQHRKFRAMVADGNMEQSTLDKMMKETKKIHGKKHPIKSLPERVKQAFMKRAGGSTGHVINHATTLSATDEINDNAIDADNNVQLKNHKKSNNSHFLAGFNKAAGGPGSGVSHSNTDTIDFLETSPIISIGYRQKFMDTHKPSATSVKISTSKIKYKGQEKMVPKKLVKMMKIWEEIKDKPVDVIVDKEGHYHILDGHHRVLAAILTKVKTVFANVYKAPRELE